MMRVLIACEYSGITRDAFARKGHYSVSCDLLDTESLYHDENTHHYVGDIRDLIYEYDWDIMIAFPPCTDICVSGARWFPQKIADGSQQIAIDFFMEMINAPIPKICARIATSAVRGSPPRCWAKPSISSNIGPPCRSIRPKKSRKPAGCRSIN